MQSGNISGAPQVNKNWKGQTMSFVCLWDPWCLPGSLSPKATADDSTMNSIGMIFAFLTVVIPEVLGWAIVKETGVPQSLQPGIGTQHWPGTSPQRPTAAKAC